MGKADPDVAWHPIYMGEGDAKCPSHFVYETAVKQSFMEMLYAIKRDHEENGENAWIDSEFRKMCIRDRTETPGCYRYKG